MAKRETNLQTQKRILVLCVDRDGDLEDKAAIKTPLLGRTANLDGAVALALKDPEEPDANAMFEAIRLYDRLNSEKQTDEIFEVATISGTDLGGVSADRKLVSELNYLQETFNPTEVILVSDGFSDEAILPLVESRVPVSSVRRIVIKHSESIEETAAVFTKYVRLLVDNPRYSRIALGLPGILVLVLGILWGVNTFYPDAIYWFGIVIVLVIGGVLLLKGFGVDRATKNLYTWAKNYQPPSLPIQISNYTIIAGILCIAVSVYLGIANVNLYLSAQPLPIDTAGWLAAMPTIAAFFIKGVENLLIVGICIIFLGRCIRLYFERDSKLLRNVALIVTVAWFNQILHSTADLLANATSTANIGLDNQFFSAFLFTILVGILIGVASVLLIYIVNKSAKGFFKKEVQTEEL